MLARPARRPAGPQDSQPGPNGEARPFYDFLESCLRHKAEMVGGPASLLGLCYAVGARSCFAPLPWDPLGIGLSAVSRAQGAGMPMNSAAHQGHPAYT